MAGWGWTYRLLGLIAALAVTAPLANGQGLSSAHERLIEGRLADQFKATKEEAEKAEIRRRQLLDVPNGSGYAVMARAAAIKHNIPPDLFERLVKAESNWNPRAISPKGAIGLAQLMPFTARALGVDPRDPRQNLEGGARYLAQQYRRFGNWRLALAAYNAGPEAVEKYGGIPPFRETRNYVQKILP